MMSDADAKVRPPSDIFNHTSDIFNHTSDIFNHTSDITHSYFFPHTGSTWESAALLNQRVSVIFCRV